MGFWILECGMRKVGIRIDRVSGVSRLIFGMKNILKSFRQVLPRSMDAS